MNSLNQKAAAVISYPATPPQNKFDQQTTSDSRDNQDKNPNKLIFVQTHFTYTTHHKSPTMAPGGPPGTSSRGRGGKFRKPARGGTSARHLHPRNAIRILISVGGKKFSRDIRPLDADGNEVSMWAVDHDKENGDEEDSSEEESSEEEEDSDDGAGPAKELTQEQTRELHKAEKKARKEAAIAKSKAKTVEVGDLPSSDSEESDSEDEDMPANPNHSKKARKQATAGVDELTEDMENLKAAPTRREREALEAAAAKEKHMRLTAQGKTDASRADLERLKAIREQRELDAARRQVSYPP